MKRLCMFAACLVALALMSVSCGSGPQKARKFYWVQGLKGHPVHQLTQIAFAEGCRKLGYACEIVGSDSMDLIGTISLAEQALAKGDAAGMAVWTGSPAYDPFIERVAKKGIPVILPHIPPPEKPPQGVTGYVGCDTREYARQAALGIGKAVEGKGTVAITQGSFNTIENTVAEVFSKTIQENYPGMSVLQAQEEGFDPPGAIAKCTSILTAHPELTAAFSTTGGGPTAWAGAQRQGQRKIVAVGMDYTRVNLDLVKAGEVYAVVGQPLWEEAYGAAELLDRSVRGEKIEFWTKLPAPLITKDKLAPYYALLEKVEESLRK
ncbi:MAG: sugar ABC transporter substrate-binding protein [Planctomycetota bacterium]|nr:sugar ABC transporter substrate-binding protein [Planctomycetota bacterium]